MQQQQQKEFNIFEYLTPKVTKLILLSALLFILDIISFQIVRYIFGETRMLLIEYRLLSVFSFIFLDILIILILIIYKYHLLKVNISKIL